MPLEDPMRYIPLTQSMKGMEWDEDLKKAVQRTIISRLYYGIFHFIKLRLEGQDHDNNMSHSKLQVSAQKYVDSKKLGINIKDHLSQLEEMRDKADYKRMEQIDERFVERAMRIYDLLEDDCSQIWKS